MRSIMIPPHVAAMVRDPQGRDQPKEVTFHDFLMTWTNDRRFGRSIDEIERALRIREQARGKVSGEVLLLEESDWLALVEAVREPADGYNVAIVSQCMPFVRAVLGAVS